MINVNPSPKGGTKDFLRLIPRGSLQPCDSAELLPPGDKEYRRKTNKYTATITTTTKQEREMIR